MPAEMANKLFHILSRKPFKFRYDKHVGPGQLWHRTIYDIPEYTTPILTPSKIKETIETSTVPFTDGYTCFKLQECEMCHPVRKKTSSGRSAETYVNKTSGFFVCELCKCCGSWESFEKLLTLKQREQDRTVQAITEIRERFAYYYEKGQHSWRNVVDKNVALHSLSDKDYSKIFKHFSFMECPKATSERLSIYISSDQRTMYIPMFSVTDIVLGYLIVEGSNVYTVLPKQDCAGLLILSQRRKHPSAIVVSNLQDFFALATQNLSVHVIFLPNGVNNLPQIVLPFLEPYESLILWLGTVPGAWDATRLFAKKLNDKRCYVIRSNEQRCSPSVAVKNNEDISKIIDEAQPTWHSAITNFSALRRDVLQELRNFDQVLGVKWKRFPPLNKTLKGFRRGELTVLTGPTGSGKTTFMSEYSLDLASQGVNTLWGSFEVRNVRLARTMMQQYIGLPLEQNLNQFESWADDFERLPIYFLTFHGQQTIKNVLDAVQHAAYIYDIAHLIIDNVQFMIGMGDDSKYTDRFHQQDLIIHAFRRLATRSNIHVTLVIHPRKEKEADDLTSSSIFGGAKAAQEADNVLIIQDKRLTSIKGKKYLQVTKNRYTGDLGVMLLDFDKSSLSFRTKKKKNIESSDSKVVEDNVKKKKDIEPIGSPSVVEYSTSEKTIEPKHTKVVEDNATQHNSVIQSMF